MSDLRPKVLSIAGSDPSGGAGLQLDVAVATLHGTHAMAVPTALTVQSSVGVKRTLPVFPNVVGDQLTWLIVDMRPDCVKIGMLATDDIAFRVASSLERFELPRVVDPVLRASDGAYLLERRAWATLMDRLVAGAVLVTPNLDECEDLVGTRNPEAAASAFLAAGAKAVLVKGGHAEGAPDDFLATGDGGEWLRGERIAGDPVHGTGCALSTSIACRLAAGASLRDAVVGAKAYVARAIAAAEAHGRGQRFLGLAPAEKTG